MATNLSLDDVKIFTRVVQAGSFTAAARQLGLPKSSVSRKVSALEEELGARLLHRTTRKLSLTDAGEVYYRRVSEAVDRLEDAERAVTQLQSAPRGLLRVTVPADLAGDYFVGLVADFQTKYPEVEVILWATGQIVDLVAEGYDVAIRAGNLPDSSLVAKKLSSSSMAMYASPSYLDGRGRPTCPSDLRDHDFLIFGRDGMETILPLEGPRGLEEVAVRGRFACNDFSVLRKGSMLGMGVVVTPGFEGARLANVGQLERVLPHYRLQAGGAMYAVYPSGRHLSPKVRAFIDFTQERVARDMV